ncbi:hypothetical protein TNCV_1877401 [Trichonephila clavipes]|nr:hypothetical protein TNCV_1877401 [Trichonephila clavipes]
MTVAPRQCIPLHRSICQAVSDPQNIIVMRHPPYSPDLTLCNFLFIYYSYILLKGNPFYLSRRGSGKSGKPLKESSENLVPELLPAMAAQNAE